jgi:hypothetical protein
MGTNAIFSPEDMEKQVVGCLNLSEEQLFPVRELIGQIAILENLEDDSHREILQSLYNQLSDILNNYTQDKFKDTTTINLLYETKTVSVQACFEATYRVFDGERIVFLANESSTSLSSKDTSNFENIWLTIQSILPSSVLKKLEYFKITRGQNARTAISTPPLSLLIRVRDNGLPFASDIINFKKTLYHETGHIISLSSKNILWPLEKMPKSSDDTSKYMALFHEKFWKYIYGIHQVNRNNSLFFMRHQNDFVSKYSTRNIREDFAESFCEFICENTSIAKDLEKVPINSREKIAFFYQFPELVSLKAEISCMAENPQTFPDKLSYSDVKMTEEG